MARVALLALSAALLVVATLAHHPHDHKKKILSGVGNPLAAHGAHPVGLNGAHRAARDLHLPAPVSHGQQQPAQKKHQLQGAGPHGLPLAAHGVAAPQIAHNGIAGALSHHQGHNQHLLGQSHGQHQQNHGLFHGQHQGQHQKQLHGQHQEQHQGLPQAQPHGQHQGLPQAQPHGQHQEQRQPLGQHQGLPHNVPQHIQNQGHQLLGHTLGVPHRAARGIHGLGVHGQQRPNQKHHQGAAPQGLSHIGHAAAPQIAGRLHGEHLLGHAQNEHQLGKLIGQVHIGQRLLKKSPLEHVHGAAAIHLQHNAPALLGRAVREVAEAPAAKADGEAVPTEHHHKKANKKLAKSKLTKSKEQHKKRKNLKKH